jgi:hypothetical protein
VHAGLCGLMAGGDASCGNGPMVDAPGYQYWEPR